MATNKQIINTRFANKSDTSANWNIASNAAKPFIPLKGEILFYTDLNKIKIGDGEHTPNQLEFISKNAEYATNAGHAGRADKADEDGAGNPFQTYYMKRGTYERIQGTSSERKNLDNYTTHGFYNVKTAYVDNCPSGIGIDADLLVYPWDGSGYECQEITETAACTTSRRWIRHKTGSTWTAWVEIITSQNIGSQSVNYATSAGSVAWGNVSGKPSTFTPASHTQAASTITGLATVATSGSYTDLSNKPTIPTVNNATLTIQKNGTTVKTFTANSASNVTANITVPTGAAADKGVDTSISAGSTSTNLPTSKAVAAFVEGKGYKTTDNNTTYSLSKSGSTITLTGSDGSTTSVTDSDTNTDTKVTQTVTSSNATYPILLAPSGQTATTTTTSYFDSGVTLNPSTNTIAANISGNAATATTASKCTGNAATATNVAWSGVTSKPSYYDAKAIKGITRSGTTFTYTCMDGTTGTFTQQDNNTTYTLGSFGITATAAELNKLDGVTATTTELNYVDGVTSNIQTQLNNKQTIISYGTTLPSTGVNGQIFLLQG